MIREAESDFRANVALGAHTRKYAVDDTIRSIAQDIYLQTGLDFLGIDLLFGKEGFYFCEINVMPGLEGIEQTTGVNVATAILETIKGDFS
jgi:glutathione synthase/RimK-type ligase-like ATP-grasp enzyme